MTFSEFVGEVEKRLPNSSSFSSSVELTQRTRHRKGEHEPLTERELEYKVWDGIDWHEGTTPEECLRSMDPKPSPQPVNVDLIDVHNVTPRGDY